MCDFKADCRDGVDENACCKYVFVSRHNVSVFLAIFNNVSTFKM